MIFRSIFAYLQWVEDCEQPGKDGGISIQSEDTEHPGQSKEGQEDEGGSEKSSRSDEHSSKWYSSNNTEN